MTLAETIKRPTLHQELVDRIRNLVIEDGLKPGEKVPEKELCEAFGVSRTPLREALKVLASEGFVVLQTNRGARVAEVTRQELEDTFPVIARLEQLAGELACVHLSDTDIAGIEARHKAMVSAYKAQDRPSYFKENQAIHKALIGGAKNKILEDHHKLLAARIQRARFMVNLSDERWAAAIAEHETMMEHLQSRDGDMLGQVMKVHIENKFRAFMKGLDAQS
ncbi:GntR family transcriptional regulator [Pelagimonas varians]|uniref:Putative HTH-type transcriptional regulator YdfH n=1 Tax=Pelagimonas varians TaxID=696760 RepID=A0A238L4H9_9RHOB|nr:GntR family transcriptional regulator [Pelagimonas varians]PYG25595.1 GntR family transcriptional regulator [Pelagimonas varians]SMX49897.1 putative HTH-type transcriptional regulator YdfH [Pelagimonas varians]